MHRCECTHSYIPYALYNRITRTSIHSFYVMASKACHSARTFLNSIYGLYQAHHMYFFLSLYTLHETEQHDVKGDYGVSKGKTRTTKVRQGSCTSMHHHMAFWRYEMWPLFQSHNPVMRTHSSQMRVNAFYSVQLGTMVCRRRALA